MQWRRYAPIFIILALTFISLIIWAHVVAATPPGKLTFAVLNVGQGDALFIESPTGVQVVIDGGPDTSLLRELPKRMPLADRTIDAVIETHPDADHITGFIDLLKRYKVGVFIEAGIPKSTLTARTLESEIDAEHIPRAIAERGMWLDLGGGARLNVLFPDYDVSSLPDSKSNEGMLVAQLVYGSTTVLLMGDAPNDIENHLMALDAGGLDSDILKVGHHGSAGSSGEQFVEDVSPQVAVISVGANNRYGHPTAQTLKTFAQLKIPVLRTDEEGTLVFISDGRSFSRIK